MGKKLISIVTPCFNEEDNIQDIYLSVKGVCSALSDYNYEHIFIDNSSNDHTIQILKKISKNDKNVKVILNTRNFGIIRSGYYGLLQARGDAVVNIAADFQDPPDIISDFIKKWEDGFKVVLAIKEKSDESFLVYKVREFYYNFVNKLSDTELIKNFTGFGLYDKKMIDILRKINDPYPYLRGMITEFGFKPAIIKYKQPVRKKGYTKNNFFSLYDLAMLGITNHSKVPLRVATLSGFVISFLSFLTGLGYFIYKLAYWDRFEIGIAPLVIGIFFFASVQLFFIGIIGEYVGSIHTQTLKRPLVIEKERINF